MNEEEVIYSCEVLPHEETNENNIHRWAVLIVYPTMTQYVGTTTRNTPKQPPNKTHECCDSCVNNGLLTNKTRPVKTQSWGWFDDTDDKRLPEEPTVVLGLVSGRLRNDVSLSL